MDSVLPGIFVVEFEKAIFPKLREHMSPWKRYVDGAISYTMEESIEHVLSKLNGYHDNVKFTYEIENDGKLKQQKQQNTVKVWTMIYIFIGNRFPQQHGIRDAAEISFKSVQSVLQRSSLKK